MNLVIDDAVEVKLATKTEEESRRQLGEDSFNRAELNNGLLLTMMRRPDSVERR